MTFSLHTLSAPSRTRSASGFTTRSDIGPGADQSESDMQAPSQQQVDAALRKQKREGDNDDTNLNETNYDEFSGYGGSLFNAGQYDDEDKEADNIYEAIDVRQDEKRKMHREKYESEQVEKFRKERFVHVHSDRPLPILHLGCAGGKPTQKLRLPTCILSSTAICFSVRSADNRSIIHIDDVPTLSRPKIQQQFADLKRSLMDVSAEEWATIPDVVDIGKKTKKRRMQDRLTAAPDSFLSSARTSIIVPML